MFLAILLWVQPAAAWFWESNILATINEREYTVEDYKSWWHQWREPGMEIHETPEPFVNFHLKVQEAETMELYTRPEYQRKVNVFRKVRSLMLLREEEILAKVGEPTDAQLRELYEQRYLPRFTLLAARFDTEDQARQFLDAVADTVPEEALASMDLEVKEHLARLEQAYAERLSPEVWEQVLNLEPGAWGKPYQWHEMWNLMQVEEEHSFDPAHFAHVRSALESQWREQRRAELNRALLNDLKQKYQVQIHRERIDQLSDAGVPSELEGQAGITFDGSDIALDVLHKAALQEVEKRSSTRNDFSYAQALDIVVSDMVAQTLTGFEAMQRHYEEGSPFKEVYTFYTQYRLTKELEKMVLKPEDLEVSAAEVKQAYADQLERFTVPEMVYMARIETREEKLAHQLRDKLQRGEPFVEVVRPLTPEGVPTRWSNPAEEPAVLQEALAGAVPGQSGVVELDDRVCFFKLLHRESKQVQEFEQVKEQLRAELEEEKRRQALADLHERLRAASEVKVNNSVWERIYTELVEEEASEA
jgi:RNA binding exosome subunit